MVFKPSFKCFKNVVLRIDFFIYFTETFVQQSKKLFNSQKVKKLFNSQKNLPNIVI